MSLLLDWGSEIYANVDGFTTKLVPAKRDDATKFVQGGTPSTPSASNLSALPASHNRKRPKDHVPRPPNAFLIYRSHFLRKQLIPRHVETKQQNLSRIIGECWRRLPAEKKEEWHAQARAVEAAHAMKHPNYVYRPVRRENVPKRRQKESEEDNRRHCEELRKAFLPETMEQPPTETTVPPRKRKSRAKKKVEPRSVVSTGSLALGGQPSTGQLAEPAFAEPLIAPSNLNHQSLEQFHGIAAPESSAFDLDFFDSNLGQYEQYPAYADEFYDTLGVDNVVAPAPPIPQPPVAPTNPSTAVNELYERYQRDKAAGAVTTTPMFNAQYTDPAFFAPQTGFFPGSQAEKYSGHTNTNGVFQNPLFPPPSFPPDQSGHPPQIHGSHHVPIIHGNSLMNFPFTLQSNGELQDLSLMNPVFNPPADNSNIAINLDNLDLFATELGLATLSGNFAQELPTPLFGDAYNPPSANDLQNWNGLDNFIATHEF